MADFDDIGYVTEIVKGMVDHPDDVKVTRTVDELGVLLEVHAHSEDMGTIIGRDGQNAKALRTILRVVGAKHDARLNLRIAEPEGAAKRERSSFARPPAERTGATEDEPALAKEEVTEEPATAPEEDKEKLDDDVPTDLLA